MLGTCGPYGFLPGLIKATAHLFTPLGATALPLPRSRQPVLTSSNCSPVQPAPRASSSSRNCSRVTDSSPRPSLSSSQRNSAPWCLDTRDSQGGAGRSAAAASRSRAGSSSAGAGGRAGAAGPEPGVVPESAAQSWCRPQPSPPVAAASSSLLWLGAFPMGCPSWAPGSAAAAAAASPPGPVNLRRRPAGGDGEETTAAAARLPASSPSSEDCCR